MVAMGSGREGRSVTPPALFLLVFLGACSLPFCRGSGEVAGGILVVRRACGGRGASECLLEKGMGVATEPAPRRRSLQQSPQDRYISYRFLNRDAVPCATPGASYYSCHALPIANPHTRGCFTITRCRGTYP